MLTLWQCCVRTSYTTLPLVYNVELCIYLTNRFPFEEHRIAEKANNAPHWGYCFYTSDDRKYCTVRYYRCVCHFSNRSWRTIVYHFIMITMIIRKRKNNFLLILFMTKNTSCTCDVLQASSMPNGVRESLAGAQVSGWIARLYPSYAWRKPAVYHAVLSAIGGVSAAQWTVPGGQYVDLARLPAYTGGIKHVKKRVDHQENVHRCGRIFHGFSCT